MLTLMLPYSVLRETIKHGDVWFKVLPLNKAGESAVKASAQRLAIEITEMQRFVDKNLRSGDIWIIYERGRT